MTLGEYLQQRSRGFRAGDRITLWMAGGRTQTIWIGDATPFHEPSKNDGGFGWDYENKYGAAKILEIVSFYTQVPEIIYKDSF